MQGKLLHADPARTHQLHAVQVNGVEFPDVGALSATRFNDLFGIALGLDFQWQWQFNAQKARLCIK